MYHALGEEILLQTPSKERKKVYRLVCVRQKGLYCWSTDYQALVFPLSPSPYQKMLLCKMSKKKEAREVISFSFLIASGIIGTLLGSLQELPASQKTAPTAPLHSC